MEPSLHEAEADGHVRPDDKCVNKPNREARSPPPKKMLIEDSIDLAAAIDPARSVTAGSDGLSKNGAKNVVIRTSTSRAVARKMCSSKRNENKVVAPPKEIEEEKSESEEEEEEVVDLFEDDEEDVNYHETDKKDLYCEVCGKGFLQVKQFIFHHRRHSSIDHYQCPTCLRGFITLKACYTHEVHQHQKKSAGGKSSAINEEPSDEEDESTANRILASNSYQLYRGLPVSHGFECYGIEEKYGLRDRYPQQSSN